VYKYVECQEKWPVFASDWNMTGGRLLGGA
jgi:hypothetical protein